MITDVTPSGVAAERGLKPGDVIVEVQQAEVASPDDVMKKVEAQRAQDRKSVLMLIQGQDGVRYVPLPLSKGKDTKPGYDRELTTKAGCAVPRSERRGSDLHHAPDRRTRWPDSPGRTAARADRRDRSAPRAAAATIGLAWNATPRPAASSMSRSLAPSPTASAPPIGRP